MRGPVKLFAALCLPVACVPVAAQDAGRAILKFVPDEAALVLFVPGLEELTGGVAAFGESAGIEQLADAEPALLLQHALGHAEGVDLRGPLLVTLSSKRDASPVLVCRLSDEAAWKQASAAVAPDAPDDLLRVTLQNTRFVAAIRDRTAVLSEDAAAVRAAMESRGWPAADALKPLLERRTQLVVFLDVPAWKEWLAETLDMVAGFVNAAMAMSGPAGGEAAARLWKAYLDLPREIAGQSGAVTGGLRFSADGVHAELRAAFRPGSEIERYLRGARKVDRDVLRGLLDRPFAFALGMEWEAPDVSLSLVDRLLRATADAMSGPDTPREQVEELMELTRSGLREQSGMCMTFAPGAQQLFAGATYTRSPQKVLALSRRMAERTPQLMNAFPGMRTTVTASDEQVGGREVLCVRQKFDIDDPQLAEAMKRMYGEDLLAYYMALEDSVAFVTASKEQAQGLLLELLERKAAPLASSDRVRAALRSISPGAQGVCLADFGRLAEMVRSLAAATGAPLPIASQPVRPAPLLAGGFYIERDAVRFELHLPSAAVRSIVEAFSGPMD